MGGQVPCGREEWQYHYQHGLKKGYTKGHGAAFAEAFAEAYAEGVVIGSVCEYCKAIAEGIITIDKALSRLGISREEFFKIVEENELDIDIIKE